MKGKIYSQGIVVKIEDIAKYIASLHDIDEEFKQQNIDMIKAALKEGDDLTELLGTKKYIPPVKGGGNSLGNCQAKGTFPTHIVSKTDEMNLASKMKYLEFFKGKHVVARLKMEGSSLTTYLDPEDFSLNVCSRNNNLKDVEGNKFWMAAKKNDIQAVLSVLPHIAIQAELMGPGVQNNKLQLTEPDMYVFTMTDIQTKGRLNDNQLVELTNRFNLKLTPLVIEWSNFDATFDELQEIADRLEYLPGVPAEGMVIRPLIPVWCDKLQGWLSMKIINRNYTL